MSFGIEWWIEYICTTATPRCGVVGWGNVRQGSPEEGGAGKGRMKRTGGARMKGRSATERQGRAEAAGGRERLARGERNEWTGREERMGGGPEGQGPRDSMGEG